MNEIKPYEIKTKQTNVMHLLEDYEGDDKTKSIKQAKQNQSNKQAIIQNIQKNLV